LSNENQRLQRIMRLYKEETGEKELDMHKVAQFAARKGYSLPKPADPIDLLAKKLSDAAREEMRYDKATNKPYRANHAYVNDQQLTLWIDIDEAPRRPMVKSVVKRREQMVSDGVQLTFDVQHWNSINLNEEPIAADMDLTDEVLWRINAPDAKAS
jgi:hypothetical protein